MSSTPYVITQHQARELLAQVDVPQILRKLFRDLAAGQAVQPAQQLVEFPQGAGDFINYLGVLAAEGVYGVKTSPYIVRERRPAGDGLDAVDVDADRSAADAVRCWRTDHRPHCGDDGGGGRCPRAAEGAAPGDNRQRQGGPGASALRQGICATGRASASTRRA